MKHHFKLNHSLTPSHDPLLKKQLGSEVQVHELDTALIFKYKGFDFFFKCLPIAATLICKDSFSKIVITNTSFDLLIGEHPVKPGSIFDLRALSPNEPDSSIIFRTWWNQLTDGNPVNTVLIDSFHIKTYTPDGNLEIKKIAIKASVFDEFVLLCFIDTANICAELNGKFSDGKDQSLKKISLEDVLNQRRVRIDANLNPSFKGWERVRDLLLSDLSANYSLCRLAKIAGTNRTTLQELFKKNLGLCVFDYLREKRLQRAMALFQIGECSIEKIAPTLGYSSGRSLVRAFKQKYGITPSQARHGAPRP